MHVNQEVAIWVSLFLNLIPIAVLWIVAGLMRRINTLRDNELHEIKERMTGIELKLDEQGERLARIEGRLGS